MDARQRRFYERGQRVDVYMDGAAEEFPAGSKGGKYALNVKEILAEIAALDVARRAGGNRREKGSAARNKTRAELRRMVASVVDTGEAIAVEHPDVKGLFSLVGKDGSDMTLIATARAFADAAAPLAGLFTEFYLPPTYFNDMRSKADSLDGSMADQNSGGLARRQSRETIENALQRLGSVIDLLDTVIRNKYRDAPDKLAVWEATRRVANAARARGQRQRAPAVRQRLGRPRTGATR